jgi:hypothetical protein
MSRNSVPNEHPTVRLAWSADRSTPDAPFDSPSHADRPSADELFAMLDGRPFRFFDSTWRLKIYSIYDHDGFRWLQVRMDGRPQHNTTLRVDVDASADDVIGALATWLIEARPASVAAPRVH